MEDSPAVQLIAVEIQNPEFVTLLNDIRDFDWKIVNRLRKEDITRIRSTGFTFKSKGLENQKQEFKSFLFDHPSVMASDLEMIISKLSVFARLVANHEAVCQQPVQSTPPPTRNAIKYEVPKKKPKKKVIVIEEEVEEQSNEEEDIEYVPVPYKHKRKPR